MSFVTIHESGRGPNALRVDSWHNGSAYAIHLGGAGSPMRSLFMQGDDAIELRASFDGAEEFWPEKPTREIWLHTVEPYL